jgi:hypothetical protein
VVATGFIELRDAVDVILALGVAADPRVLGVPAEVVADVEVEVAVAVEVRQRRPLSAASPPRPH